MGLRGGIGCLLALFVGLVWLECTVSTIYYLLRSLKISLCIINTPQWIILVLGQVPFRWFDVFSSLISEREFNNFVLDSRTNPTEISCDFSKYFDYRLPASVLTASKQMDRDVLPVQ